MTKEEILLKFILAKERPSKYNITRILNIGVSTLRRLGFVVSELQKEYDLLTEKERRIVYIVMLNSLDQKVSFVLGSVLLLITIQEDLKK